MTCMFRMSRAAGWLADGVEGMARFHDLVAAHAEEPQDVVIGIETDRGLFVAARRSQTMIEAFCQQHDLP